MESDPFVMQWQHNRRLIEKIPATHPDWVVTISFYTAVHAINAMLSRSGVDVTSHKERNDILMNTHTYADIWVKYNPLYDMARKVRYFAEPHRWAPYQSLHDRVLSPYLYKIEALVQRQLKITLDLPKIVLSQATTEA